MSYRQELQVLVNELRQKSTKAKSEKTREKYRRQAEILDFLINHPQDAIGALDA